MVAVDFLQFRKNKARQPMQYAWFAATTRNFVGPNADKISKKEINDLDIGSLCDDIISEMSDSQEGTRLTLYLSSMLSSGAVKLFQQQAVSLEDDCQKLMLDLLGGPENVTQKKKKKTKAKAKKTDEAPPEEPINLSVLSIPNIDISKVLDKKNLRDVHLMSEMDFIEVPEIPQSFGFNPNERELTEREMDRLYREMMGQDPQPVIPEDVPQDNQFEMNDVPMIPAPVANLLENQVTPPGSPHRGWEGLKTPRRKKHPANAAPKSTPSSEAAKTAYSPPKKRSRMTYRPQEDADIDDGMMVAAEPGQEAAFPGDLPREAPAVASPIFDFRKKRSRRHNVTLPLRKNLADVAEKGSAVAAMFAEPPLDDRVQHESAPLGVPEPEPVVQAQVELPDVSVYDPLAAEQPEANAATQSPNQSHRASPPPAAPLDVDASTPAFPKESSKISELSLSAINSFEEHSRKRYIKRGKKIFADRIKQAEIEPRPADFMTIPRKEALFPHALKHQPVLSLLSRPATMKTEMYLPKYRFWSDRLELVYREHARIAPKTTETNQKTKKKRARSRENRQQSIEQNKEQPIEAMDIVPEQREPSLPKNIDTNDEPIVNVPEQRADFVPEDNRMDVETAEPAAHVSPAADVQTEKAPEQSSSEVIHDAPNVEIEQPPPPVEPVFEVPRVPDPIDEVEAAMSPPKRFKRGDERDLQAEETRSDRCLTVDELLEIIKSCWNKVKKKYIDRFKCVRVAYEKVIKPGHYSGVEAARYLQHCFTLENMQKLYLDQEAPYDTVYLIKW